jgi:hypothetical protein
LAPSTNIVTTGLDQVVHARRLSALVSSQNPKRALSGWVGWLDETLKLPAGLQELQCNIERVARRLNVPS